MTLSYSHYFRTYGRIRCNKINERHQEYGKVAIYYYRYKRFITSLTTDWWMNYDFSEEDQSRPFMMLNLDTPSPTAYNVPINPPNMTNPPAFTMRPKTYPEKSRFQKVLYFLFITVTSCCQCLDVEGLRAGHKIRCVLLAIFWHPFPSVTLCDDYQYTPSKITWR